MGQSIEEVLNRLVAVEDAAQQMQDAVDAQKKELAAQMEEKKKQFDSMQNRRPKNWKQTWSTRRQPRWKNSGRKRKNSLPECSTSMIQSTTGFRMKFCSP